MPGFEPLGIAISCCEVRVRDDSPQERQVGFNPCDGGILKGPSGFAHGIRPGACCDDDFGNHAVEIARYDCWGTVDEGCIHTRADAGGKLEGLDLADAQCVVLLDVFGCDAELDRMLVGWAQGVSGETGEACVLEGGALGETQLGFDNVGRADGFRDCVLDLQAGIDF